MSVRRLSLTAVLLVVLASCGTTATAGTGTASGGSATTSAATSAATTATTTGGPTTADPPSTTTAATTTSRTRTTTRTATNRTATATPQSSPTTCASLDNCYAKSNIDQFYSAAIGLVAEFSNATYGTRVPAPRYVFVPSGRSVSSACGGSSDQAYEYCPPDGTVYVGQEQLWQFYSDAGDAGAAAGIAHEWGHHLQNVFGVTGPVLTREEQADCVAGAWLAYMASVGRLEQGDIGDVERLIRFIASAETPDRDHGTMTERTNAFNYGYTKGIAGCSEYFPATPLGVS